MDAPQPLNVNTTSADSVKTLKMDSKKFKNEIIGMIQPTYLKDVKYAMSWRTTWHKISSWLNVIDELFIAASIIIAYIAASTIVSAEAGPKFAFVAGSCGTMSRILARFSASAKARSRKKTDELNELLAGVGINYKVPDLTDDDTGNDSASSTPKSLRSKDYFAAKKMDVSATLARSDQLALHDIDIEMGPIKEESQLGKGAGDEVDSEEDAESKDDTGEPTGKLAKVVKNS